MHLSAHLMCLLRSSSPKGRFLLQHSMGVLSSPPPPPRFISKMTGTGSAIPQTLPIDFPFYIAQFTILKLTTQHSKRNPASK
ncbi:hypothetical protein BX666DRAFT_1924349 [Dichotomocladium elegans]|nr:hypothetical protein BX666DRAFT_1924349 [Dichotomocladium elegans]